MKKLYTLPMLCLLGGLLLSGCGDDDEAPATPTVATVQGENKTLSNNGKLETWARTTNGKVDQVGISLDQAAFDLLTAETSASMHMLNFPQAVTDQTGMTMGTVDWNPQGHPQVAQYAVPHFDFHYYLKDHATIMAIAGGVDGVPVGSEFYPTGYAYGPPNTPAMAVPQMGVHYVDMTAAEFNGQPFTKTFVYGFSQGQHVFLEPMITKAYLQSHPNSTTDIKQPAAYQMTGKMYPTKYTVRHDASANKYHILLEGFVQR